MSGISLQRKNLQMKTIMAISLAAIGINLDGFKGVQERTHVARYVGKALELQIMGRGAKAQESIMGDFRAINVANGEEFKSHVIYFPRGLQERVVYALNDGNEVEFAFDIYIEPDLFSKAENGSYGISYEDLLEDKAAIDPLKGLMDKLPKIKK